MPVSDVSSGGGYKLPKAKRKRRDVPRRHSRVGVFAAPIPKGPALAPQVRAQHGKVRRAQEKLPGPAVALPRRPILKSYTPAQRREIIRSTSAAVRKAAAAGQLDDFLAHHKGEAGLWRNLGQLTDKQTRRAVHKYAGALQTRQMYRDAALGRKVAGNRLTSFAPTLRNLAEIGRKVREGEISRLTAQHGEIKPGGGVDTKLLGLPVEAALEDLGHRAFPEGAPGLRILKVPVELAKATVEDPVGVGKASARSFLESIAGLPQGLATVIQHPKAGLKGIAADYAHRYGPLLEGNEPEFRKRVQEESGLTPFALDVGGAGAAGGRALGAVARAEQAARAAAALEGSFVARPLGRLIRGAHETATRERPGLRFSGGEGGVKRQETSRNLFVATGQQALDEARRRRFERDSAKAGLRPGEGGKLERIPGAPEDLRSGGLRPGAGEVLPYYSLREAPGLRRFTGRVSRDLGKTKSRGRIKLLTRRGKALADIDRQMRRLTPEESAALFPVVKYGLPAIHDATSRAQALDVITRRLAQIKRERKSQGRSVSRVLGETNDEVRLLRAIQREPEKYLTPTLRDAADELIAVQRREEQLDPDLPTERAQIRRDTPQGALLGVKRGPDVAYLQDRLSELELLEQARGRRVETGQLQESHGALAAMHPEARPAAAREIEGRAKQELNAAQRELQAAREELAANTGRAEILSRNVTGTRVGEKAAAAGGGHGVAQATRRVEEAKAAVEQARDSLQAARAVTRDVGRKETMRLEGADEFDARVRDAAEKAGLSEPGYWLSSPRPTTEYSTAAIGAGGRAAARSKRYTGALHDIGAETHTPDVFIRGVERNIKRRFSWALVNRNMEVHAFEWSRGRQGEGLSAAQILKELDERHIDADSVAFINARIVRKREPEETGLERGTVTDAGHAAEDDVLAATNAELAESRRSLKDLQAEEIQGQALNRYLAVPREVADELEHATRPDGPGARMFEIVFKQKPSRILLGLFNLPWLGFQVASNAFLTGLGGGFSPFDVYGAHKWWRGLTDAQKDAVEAELGITHGRHFAMDQPHLGSQAKRLGPAAHLVDFWHGYRATKVGRSLHRANPLDAMFRADEAQNNFFRRVLFYSKAKREAYKRMGASWKGMDRAQARLMSVLGQPPEKLGGAIVTKGRVFEEHAKHVNDFLGDYLTFSNHERRLLSRNVMFYGYLRYSLRFALWTMPVEHPIVTAILGNIGRLGSQEIHDLFGVPRNYRLPTSMLARVYLGSSPEQVKAYVESGGLRGKLPSSIDIGRANPALNAVTQVEGAQQLVGLVSPLYQALADQLFEESSFTGKDFRIKGQPTPAESERASSYYGNEIEALIPGSDRNRILVADLLGLAYPYRLATKTGIPRTGIEPLTGSQGDDSLLFSPRPIQYKSEDIKRSIARSAREQKDAAATHLLPGYNAQDIGPVIVAREREKLADELDRAQGPKKRKRRRSKVSLSSTYGGGSSSGYDYGGGASSSYRSRYGG